ncbi:sigma-70 family RNA polymerase sigma factor [bacterium]|nr:sigma-70 family RNA polymerase sigma factor [bacterium]
MAGNPVTRDNYTIADAELVQGCLDGDENCWEILIKRYQKLVYSVPLKYQLSRDDADDVFQTVCIILLEKLKTLRDLQSLSVWIYVTTKRQCWKVLKEKQREEGLRDNQELRLIEQGGDELFLQFQIARSVERLPRKCRDLLSALYYTVPPLSYGQVSERLGFPPGSIGPTRARCLNHLRKILAKKKLKFRLGGLV